MMKSLSREQSALLETGLLFLPAIPAYLWIWPSLHGLANDVFQVIVYIYVFAGTLWIGLRRWNLNRLGINRDGLPVALLSGLPLLLGRCLIIRAVDFGLPPAQYNPVGVILNLLYYIGMVGLVEELLFRGLVYRALSSWLGTGWAISGSAIGFMLWHIFGQGPVIGITTLLIGIIFALIRWRAGGITVLILVHGLWDLETVFLAGSASNQEILRSPQILSLGSILLGLCLLVLVPIYLWLLHARVMRLFASRQNR